MEEEAGPNTEEAADTSRSMEPIRQQQTTRKRKNDVDMAIIDYLKSNRSLRATNTADESDFGRCVASSIEQLPERRRHRAKAKIMEMLSEIHAEVYE